MSGRGWKKVCRWILTADFGLKSPKVFNSTGWDGLNLLYECGSVRRVNDVKTGTLIGVDKYGNKYYEDKKHYFFGESGSYLQHVLVSLLSIGRQICLCRKETLVKCLCVCAQDATDG